MYEDDRQTALSMYSQLFDEVDDDQALMQQLMSPTRQAVVIARSYDSKSKKLQVRAESRSGKTVVEEGTPKFVTAIRQIEQEALAQQAKKQPHVSEYQISMFDSAPAEESFDDDTAATVSSEEIEMPETVENESAEAPATEFEVAEEPVEEPEAPDDTAVAPVTADEDEQEEESDPVDAFISGLTIEGIKEPEKPVKAEKPRKPVIQVEPEEETEVVSTPQYYTERKAIVPLLVLYILFAVPIGLVLIALLLIPTAISLTVACAAIGAGAVTLTAAFSGFAVFADILIVLGCALLLLAVGLLFLWLFVWFIGGVMVSLVKGIISLGDKLCYREVAA